MELSFSGRRKRLNHDNNPAQTCSWKVAVALACGNTCVYKPSPFAPVTPVIMAEIITAAGAPPGAVNIVQARLCYSITTLRHSTG